MGVQHLTARLAGGSFGVLETLSPEMAQDFCDVFSLVRNGTRTSLGSPRHTENTVETVAPVRTPLAGVNSMGVQQPIARPAPGSFGILETLSPEMARDLGNAFCVGGIGTKTATKNPRNSGAAAREALRFVSHVAAFLLVAAVAVSLAATAMYLMPSP